ncbi:MAG: hypothetical protein ACK4NA_12890 [Alphaproteobacteria bacterium]
MTGPDELLNLSKDVGKLAERTARLEESTGSIKEDISDVKAAVREGFDALAKREQGRDERDQKIADHMAKVCTLAKLAIFAIKFALPAGGLAGVLGFARAMGWL